MNALRKLKSKPGYKWVIVACCFLMVFACLGFCSSTKNLYLAAVTDALNIERGLYSINDSVRFLTQAIMNLFFGSLVMKFGPRKMIGAGFLSLVLSMLLYSYAESMPLFYVAGFLLGLGLAWTSTAVVGYVINHWCKEQKGTIMGLVLAANGFGGAFAAQIVSPIINSHTFGYRTAYLITAIMLVVLGAVIVILFKNKPDGVQREAHKGRKAKAGTWTGMTFQESLRTPCFWLAAFCLFLHAIVTQGSNNIYAAHMRDEGLNAEYIAIIVSVHSLSLVGFKLLTGVLYDKFGIRVTMLICNIALIVMILLLANVSNTPGGMAIAMAQSLISSMALPMGTVLEPLLIADLFGEKEYAKVMGVLFSVAAFGSAVGAPIANWFYDLHGTYRIELYIMCVGAVLLAILLQITVSSGNQQRKKYESRNTEVI